jgi:hypothetical protein
VRRSTAVRAAALTVLAAGVAAPLVRRRLRLRPPVVMAAAASAPVALCVLVPRTRTRDFCTCLLQMFAYIAAYKMPYDDPEALERLSELLAKRKMETEGLLKEAVSHSQNASKEREYRATFLNRLRTFFEL